MFLHWIILSIIIVWCVLKDIWWVSEQVLLYLVSEQVLLYLVSEWASVVISGEWVSECCYIWWVSEQMKKISAISWWEQVTFRWDDNDFSFVLDPELSWIFYSASWLKQQSAGSYVALLWNIMLIPKPTSLCSYRYFFKLHA